MTGVTTTKATVCTFMLTSLLYVFHRPSFETLVKPERPFKLESTDTPSCVGRFDGFLHGQGTQTS